MREFQVNKHLFLRLEDESTIIYVGGERFRQCKYLLLNIQIDEIQSLDEIESIDEVAEKLDESQEFYNLKKRKFLLRLNSGVIVLIFKSGMRIIIILK